MKTADILKRLRREFIKVNVLQASLDALVVFLSLNLLLFLFGVNVFPAVPDIVALTFIGLAFFLSDLAYRARNYRLEVYEERNPQLHEILRTARDNPEQDTFVARAMVQDLTNRLRSVSSDSIVPNRVIIQKIVVVGALSFLTLLSGVTNFQIQDTDASLLPSVTPSEGVDDDREVLRNSSEIYGEKSDISASDLDLGFNITGEGDRESSDSTGSFASGKDAAVEAAERKLSEDLALAKQYSLAIKEFRQQ